MKSREIVSVRPIMASHTHSLRWAILRAGMPLESAIFEGDETALHFGAFEGERLVGVASLFRNSPPGSEENAFQLRGMAVSRELQGAGIGRILVGKCLEEAKSRGIALVWCNARTPAVGFYEKLGFEKRGEEFEYPTAGPHWVMWRRV